MGQWAFQLSNLVKFQDNNYLALLLTIPLKLKMERRKVEEKRKQNIPGSIQLLVKYLKAI